MTFMGRSPATEKERSGFEVARCGLGLKEKSRQRCVRRIGTTAPPHNGAAWLDKGLHRMYRTVHWFCMFQSYT